MNEENGMQEEWKDPIDITKEQWMAILGDREIVTNEDFRLLKILYGCEGCEARASRLAQLLNIPHHASINSQVGRLGKRIVEKINVQAPLYHHPEKYGEGFNWWNVPFWGEKRKGNIYWILRPELQEALREMEEEKELLLEITIPEEMNFDTQEHLYEGAMRQIYVNSYERNRNARDQCVEYYGPRCIICGFDFEKGYGEVGRDVIHVHHLKPLSDIGENYRIDPINDLRPICPNCHVIIHRKNPPYSIDEVMAMMINARSK